MGSCVMKQTFSFGGGMLVGKWVVVIVVVVVVVGVMRGGKREGWKMERG